LWKRVWIVTLADDTILHILLVREYGGEFRQTRLTGKQGTQKTEDTLMGATEDGAGVAGTTEAGALKEVRDALVEALLRESREELERIDLKASILLSVFGLALVGLAHAVAFEEWDPRNLGAFQWFLWSGVVFAGAALVALAGAVWPKLAHGKGEEGLTYFGHVAQHKKVEELNAALDREAAAHPTPTDHAAKRLLAVSKIVETKYRWIRWGMGFFALAVPLWAVAIIVALSSAPSH
jgi:hypothetical protein